MQSRRFADTRRLKIVRRWCILGRLKTIRGETGLVLGLLFVLAAELGVLRSLPYSTSWIEAVSDSDVGARPTKPNPGYDSVKPDGRR